MIWADFLRRRIAPLHNKGRPAWLSMNAADIMRLRPGLDHNLTVLRHAYLCQWIFQLEVNDEGEVEQSGKAARAAVKACKVAKEPVFKLPAGVVLRYNNSCRSEIIAMIPFFNTHGLDLSWVELDELQVQEFFDTLHEGYITTEPWLI